MRLRVLKTKMTSKGFSKFNPTTCTKIIECIRQGNFRVTAAQIAGITPKTFSVWMRSTDAKFAKFQKDVINAEAEVEACSVAAIRAYGIDKDPKFLCWWLERKFKRWNSAVHRWELQLLQKQLKELKNVIGKLSQDTQGNSQVNFTSPEFEASKELTDNRPEIDR